MYNWVAHLWQNVTLGQTFLLLLVHTLTDSTRMTSFHNSDHELDRAIAVSLDEHVLKTTLEESNEIEDRKQMERLHRNITKCVYSPEKF